MRIKKNKWYLFDPSKGFWQPLPKQRQYVHVLVKHPKEPAEFSMPPTVAVGYLKFAGGEKQEPKFIVPGVLGERVAWCDCLSEDAYPTQFCKEHNIFEEL